MKFNKILISALLLGGLGFSSCSDDFLNTVQTNVESQDQIDQVIEGKPEQLVAFMRGINLYMIQYGAAGSTSHDDFGLAGMLHCADMNGDDMVLVNNGSGWFMYDQDLSNNLENYRRPRINWYTPYTIISKCNSLIDLLDANSEDESIQAFLGQAYALRAMSNYYMINFFQHIYDAWDGANGSKPGIPIVLAEKEGESKMGRNTVKEVLMHIQNDYETSLSHFGKAGSWKREDKSFIDKYVANGLAARFYLMTQQWDKAQKAAAAALQGGASLMTGSEYLAGFSDIANTEWMWGADVNAITTTVYASFFSHISNVSPGYAGIGAYRAISSKLYAQMPDEDMRKEAYIAPRQIPSTDKNGVVIKDEQGDTIWVEHPQNYWNLKFGEVANFENDIPYMRAAEMYLIQAEAYAQQGMTAEAGQMLSTLLAKRYTETPTISSATVEDVLLQRRIELWGEGFSLFDLKRTNTPIMRGYEGSNFQAAYQYNAAIQNNAFNLQIPLNEIIENPNISEGNQNPLPPLLEPWSIDNPVFNGAN